MEVEVWKREPVAKDDDPMVEINLPVVSIRSCWPFLYWWRDRFYPWSLHIHLPGRRVLTLRARAAWLAADAA